MEQKAPNDAYEQQIDSMIDIYCKIAKRIDHARKNNVDANYEITQSNLKQIQTMFFKQHMVYINHLVFTDEVITKIKEIQITLQAGFETLSNNDAGISQSVLDNFDKQVDDFAASPAGQELKKENDIITNP